MADVELRAKLGRVNEDHRQLKRWLTSIKPEELSRAELAEEFGVRRKTFANMISPEQTSFGSGLTMLLYLRLAGALQLDPPRETAATSRLAAIEEKADEALAGIADILALLEPDESDADAQEETH